MRISGLFILLLIGALPALPIQAQNSLSHDVETVDGHVTAGSFRELSQRLMPAVVNISTSQTIVAGGLPQVPEDSPMRRFNDLFGRDGEGFRKQGSLGSGFVISADGLIVTNNHVIEHADEIEINFSDGSVLEAKVLGRDPDTDLALLKVESDRPLAYVDFADSDKAEVGDWVMAIGNPFGFGGSVSAGIISAKSRDLNSGRSDDFIQTDAAINKGNSGGPLFNLGGEVVGVNSAIISPTGGSVGIGFSIPSNLTKRIVQQLKATGKVRRGWLGVNVQPVDAGLLKAYGASAKDGVIISSVSEGGPASRDGLRVGDLIVSFNGKPIAGVRGLTRTIADAPIGKAARLEIIRSGKRQTVSVTLGELEQPDLGTPDIKVAAGTISSNELGAELTPVDDDARRRHGIPRDVDGLLVTSVSPRGAAFGKLKRGDVIVEMGFETVATVEDVTAALDLAAKTPGRPLLIRVNRRGVDVFYSVDIKK